MISPRPNTHVSCRYVIKDTLSAEDYVRLYRACNCYVTASHGEGWGMPVTEAMSMGLPAIVTNWSGMADIVNEDVGYLVNYTLSDVGISGEAEGHAAADLR